MSAAEKISKTLGLAASDMASLAKVMLQSKRVGGCRSIDSEKEIFILGNGPSLREAIDNYGDQLACKELMAVNFFANTPDFERLRPRQYILADGHFFDGVRTDTNVARLWERLSAKDWEMTLHVPASRKKQAQTLFNGKINLFNLTPLEGHDAFIRPLMSRGLGMPRPRNVMIPAIMIAINAGYGHIYLLGADHTWSRTLSVDDKNRVLSRQPHFYADNDDELDRVAEEYKGYHLHDILNSLTIAFRSYHNISRYAASKCTEIVNLTPGSMIDAFPRQRLGDVLQK